TTPAANGGSARRRSSSAIRANTNSGAALRRVLQTRNDRPERGQGIPRSVCFALLEIVAGLSHRVGDMSEAKHLHPGAASKGVQGCSFHLDCEDVFAACGFDGFCGLPKRRVRGPACTYDAVESALYQCCRGLVNEVWVSFRELGRRR